MTRLVAGMLHLFLLCFCSSLFNTQRKLTFLVGIAFSGMNKVVASKKNYVKVYHRIKQQWDFFYAGMEIKDNIARRMYYSYRFARLTKG